MFMECPSTALEAYMKFSGARAVWNKDRPIDQHDESDLIEFGGRAARRTATACMLLRLSCRTEGNIMRFPG